MNERKEVMVLEPEMLKEFLKETKVMCAHMVDKKGIVRFINKSYLNVLGKEEKEVIGCHIDKITPGSRTLTVIKTGKAIIGYNWVVNGYHMLASATPIIRNGKRKGSFAYSIFMDIWDAKNIIDNLTMELKMYQNEVHNIYAARYTFDQIIGEAQSIIDMKCLAEKAAFHPSITILINGESGTGKELLAHAIHSASRRNSMPFIRVNCAAIPENLLEAELFGYEEGSFTGARKGGSTGKLELAHGGTVFLDEIGEMSPAMQSKLLVFLQEREFERVGSHKPIRVDVRVIAATNRNLEDMIIKGEFREDLYYRLNVLKLVIPPLRERMEDLPLLIDYFLPVVNKDLKTNISEISTGAMELLSNYSWPGNVREVVNVLQKAVLLADLDGSQTITPRQLSFVKIGDKKTNHLVSGTLKERMENFEKQQLVRVLKETNYNKTKAAAILDMDLSWLYKKIKRYGLVASR